MKLLKLCLVVCAVFVSAHAKADVGKMDLSEIRSGNIHCPLEKGKANIQLSLSGSSIDTNADASQTSAQ